jgi:predicted GIY-YIG superfamily endonuclease
MSSSGIYKIQSVCKPERIYIGSAVDIARRWREHVSCLKKNKHEEEKTNRSQSHLGLKNAKGKKWKKKLKQIA